MPATKSAEVAGGSRRVAMGTTAAHHGPAMSSASSTGSPLRTLADASASGNSSNQRLAEIGPRRQAAVVPVRHHGVGDELERLLFAFFVVDAPGPAPHHS